MRVCTEEKAVAEIPVISIVGKSNAGKTTLLVKLVAELKNRGYRVGTIKHGTHDFEIDIEGKDSWRHKQAGACTVAVSSPNKIAIIKDVGEEESIDSLASQFFKDVDILITEGYKKDRKPKIEVFRSQVHDKPLCQDDERLVAFVSDAVIDRCVPHFDLGDAKGLADFVEKTFLTTAKGGLSRRDKGDEMRRAGG